MEKRSKISLLSTCSAVRAGSLDATLIAISMAFTLIAVTCAAGGEGQTREGLTEEV